MTNLKIKAPYDSMDLKEYKLSDFIPEFSEIDQSDDFNINRSRSTSKKTYSFLKNGKIYYKDKNPICPKCNSKKIDCDGKRERQLIFLDKGHQIVFVERYECKECGYKFETNLIELVKPNSNITKPLIDYIRQIYSCFSASIHNIRKFLNKEHNIKISHQTIENIILGSESKKEPEKWSLSGYYCFDSLWVKKNGKWKYLLALFDSLLNTIVSYKLADSESITVIRDFLEQSLANQKKIAITTDLKSEYTAAIDKINIKHVFCRFHAQQKINRDIRNYLRKNKVSDEDLEKIKYYKKLIFKIFNSETIENAKSIRNELISSQKELPEIIFKILWNLIIPDFKKLTYAIEDEKIESTNNKIENSFQKIFPKHIKRKYKTDDGILTRFNLKLNKWNEENLFS